MGIWALMPRSKTSYTLLIIDGTPFPLGMHGYLAKYLIRCNFSLFVSLSGWRHFYHLYLATKILTHTDIEEIKLIGPCWPVS